MIEPVLVLVCKRPALGIGKQRLAADIGQEAAADVAEALLACALEDLRVWTGPKVIAPSNPADCAWASSLLPQAFVQPQANGNLGQRLNRLDQELRNAGMKKLIYIGSDSPQLAEADYAAACAGLLDHDTVFKPAADGGVVLMANRQSWPPLGHLPWSKPRLGSALVACCRKAGYSAAMLIPGFDVDQGVDIDQLAGVLETDSRPARRALHFLACNLLSVREENHAQF